MRIYLHCFFAVLFTMVAASCGTVSSHPSVDIEISNASTNDLTWVNVRWDDAEYGAGVLPQGVSKGSLHERFPKNPKSNIATIEFANDKDGWNGNDNSERKLYKIPLDVSALSRLDGGHYCVTFSILSLTNASLQIKEEVK